MDQNKIKLPGLLIAFICISICCAYINICSIPSSWSYLDNCQPEYKLVSQEVYDAGEALSHEPEIVNQHIDPDTPEAQEALSKAREKFKKSDWYKTEIPRAASRVSLAIAATILSAALIITGSIIGFKTKLQTPKLKNTMRILLTLLIAMTMINTVLQSFVVRCKGPLVIVPVPDSSTVSSTETSAAE